jgi:hypothetical protein
VRRIRDRGCNGVELTLRQRCFVDEYRLDLNATQAAVRDSH